MLRSIIICPDHEVSAQLEQMLIGLGETSVLRTLSYYPAAAELVRTLRAHAPDTIFLSFEALDKAESLLHLLEEQAQDAQVIGVHRAFDPEVMRAMMRLGVREFAAFPFEAPVLADCVRHAAARLGNKHAEYGAASQIFSFLPSKAGAGASTLALNVAFALSREANAHVLLSDFDLSSGMMRFLLKLQNTYSVLDAVEHSVSMDEHLWPQLVTSIGNLDVLHAGKINPSLRIEPAQIRNLMQFMRRNYTSLCFDLSGNLERYSVEIMNESKRVLLVCTPEIPSLHLAREKLQFLRSVELHHRTVVVLNRMAKKPLFSQSQVSEIIGAPVVASISNDYRGVADATAAGSVVEPKSDLGKRFAAFAAALMEPGPPEEPRKRKFLEQFNVPAAGAVVPR